MARTGAFDYSLEFGEHYHRLRSLPPRLEQWISGIRAEKLSDFIKVDDLVFEYGVGFGWNLARLRCASKVGFDVSSAVRSRVEANGIRFVSDIRSIKPLSFEKVLCHHSLEHVDIPFTALTALRSLLIPSGALVLMVPFEREAKYRCHSQNEPAHHLYSWTPATISHILAVSGFKVDKCYLAPFCYDRAAARFAARIGGGESAYRLIRRLAMALLPEYEIRVLARPLAFSSDERDI